MLRVPSYLGRQTPGEFQGFTSRDDGRKFTALCSAQQPHEQSTKSLRQNPSKLYHVASQARETVTCDAGLHDAEGNRSGSPAIPPHRDRSPHAAHPLHRFLIVD